MRIRDSALRSSVLYLLLAAAMGIVYAPSLHGEFLSFDDTAIVSGNPLVTEHSWGSIAALFTSFDPELYIPLTLLSFHMEHLLLGPHPFHFHLVSLLLHGFNTFLVFALTKRWSGRESIGFLSALLFALHPLQTEAVAWISARKDLLSAFFLLSALLSYQNYTARRTTVWYGVSLTLFLCALLAKVTVLIFPFLVLLETSRTGKKLDRSVLRALVPFFVLSLFFGMIAALGKSERLAELSPIALLLLASKNITVVLGKFLVPTHLSIVYPQHTPITLFSTEFFLPLLLVGALTVATILARRWSREVPFAAGFAAVSLAPSFFAFTKASGIYYATDKYAYIPLLGLTYLLCMIVSRLWQPPVPDSQQLRCAWLLSLLFLACTWGILTHERSTVWRDDITLYGSAITQFPELPRLHRNLGAAYEARGELRLAAQSYQYALERDPHNEEGQQALQNLQERLRVQQELLNENLPPP